MKIIHRGTPKKERSWLGRCTQCKSTAEASESELKHIEYDLREHGSFSWEKCPVCNAGEAKTGYNGMLFYPKL